jgi:hypothetical protein
MVGLLITAILFVVFDSCMNLNHSENYDCRDRSRVNYDALLAVPQVPNDDFLSRRLCSFPEPDYGQYTYGGCRCSRIGVPMNNGMRSHDDSGLYREFPTNC